MPRQIRLQITMLRSLLMRLRHLIRILLLVRTKRVLRYVHRINLNTNPLHKVYLQNMSPRNHTRHVRHRPRPSPITLIKRQRRRVHRHRILITRHRRLQIHLLPRSLHHLNRITSSNRRHTSLLTSRQLTHRHPHSLRINTRFPINNRQRPLRHCINLPNDAHDIANVKRCLDRHRSRKYNRGQTQNAIHDARNNARLIGNHLHVSAFRHDQNPHAIRRNNSLTIRALDTQQLICLARQRTDRNRRYARFPQHLVNGPLPSALTPSRRHTIMPTRRIVTVRRDDDLAQITNRSRFMRTRQLQPSFKHRALRSQNNHLFNF